MLAASLKDLVNAIQAEPATQIDYTKLHISKACDDVIAALREEVAA